MGAFLARELFSIAGIKVNIKTILLVVAAIIAAILIYFAYSAVSAHFKHVADLEAANKQLTSDKQKLEDQKTSLEDTIMANQKEYDKALEQKNATTGIANDEAKDSATRTANYQGIKDVIHQVPATTRAVDPIVLRTAQQLWAIDPAQDSK